MPSVACSLSALPRLMADYGASSQQGPVLGEGDRALLLCKAWPMTDESARGFATELAIRAYGSTTWTLTEDLVWTGERQTFTVPAGFVTDFATSPRFLHWLWLPYGAYTRAAVLHDYLLVELAAGNVLADSRDCDGIFRAAMRDLGVGWPKRWLGWTAVRWGALFSRKRAYGRGFAQDAPKVLGMSVLVLGSVLIPVAAVAVLLALGLVKVVTALSGGKPVKRRPDVA